MPPAFTPLHRRAVSGVGHLAGICAPLLLVFAATAFAQGDVIPKVNGSCPSGYRNGPGAYCYQNSYGAQRDAIEKVGGKCPSGYSNGPGSYCYENKSTREQDVVVKVNGRCPSGYRDGPGAYCYR